VRRPPLLAVIVAVCLAIAGCTSSSDGASPATTSRSTSNTTGTTAPARDPRGGVLPGYPTDVDEATPLLITTVAPDPIPVTGTDGKVHVVYELSVLNYSPRDATFTRLQTLAGGPDGKVVATVEGAALAERTVVVPYGLQSPVPYGRTALLLVDDVYDTKADVPPTVTHRLDATFGELTPGFESLLGVYPGRPVSLIGGPVTTSADSPVVIGPPLAGADWWAGNGCCEYSPHRGAMLPMGGRINASERYAIDWFKPDRSLDAAAWAAAVDAGALPTFRGDPTKNESYIAYGEPLLAVADGTIVSVVSDMPDLAPKAQPTGLEVGQFGGNLVVIDIGGGVYASYAHLAPGSPTVRVGDKVTRGQVIGRLGNSGNTTEAHLHFQLQRTPTLLLGDNVPFEIDTFTFAGSIASREGFVAGPNAGPRTDQLPLIYSVVDFPAAP